MLRSAVVLLLLLALGMLLLLGHKGRKVHVAPHQLLQAAGVCDAAPQHHQH
jgi:hypothetical protein